MGNWIVRLLGKRAVKPAPPRDIGAELLADWEALSAASERPAQAQGDARVDPEALAAILAERRALVPRQKA